MKNEMNWQELKKELLKDENFNREYNQPDLAFEIGEMVIDARVKFGLTQAELAKLAETQQPSIARLENGTTLPTLTFLEKLAKSMGTYLVGPRFAFLDEQRVEVKGNVADVIQWNAQPTILAIAPLWGEHIMENSISSSYKTCMGMHVGMGVENAYQSLLGSTAYYLRLHQLTAPKVMAPKEESAEIKIENEIPQYA
jgi:transcriptional regulator with XRE-family HTH domain